MIINSNYNKARIFGLLLFVNLANYSENRFPEFSQAGGVIDLQKAAEYAYTNFYNGNKTSANKKPAKSIKKAVKK